MVDFSKLVKQPARPPSGIVGHLTSWRKHHTNGTVVATTCQYRLGPRPSISHGVWTVFELIEGGVTGHESVVLIDDKGVHLSTVNNLLNQPYWCCNAGTRGVWDEQRITRDELRRVLVPLLEAANRPGKCWKCGADDGMLAEDPLLLRVADRYEYNYWCCDCHSTRDKESGLTATA